MRSNNSDYSKNPARGRLSARLRFSRTSPYLLKWSLCLLLLAAMIPGSFPGAAKAAPAAFPGSGSGKAFDPYVITDYDGLNWIRNTLNTKVYYKLGANIDLSGYNWQPIGSYESPFKGVLDGNDHTISNLTIDNGTYHLVGLFQVIRSGGRVENLHLDQVNVVSTFTPSGGYYPYVGALAGYMADATVSHVIVSGQVGSKYSVGLLSGEIAGDSLISDVIISGAVTTSGLQVGGVTGDLRDNAVIQNADIQVTVASTQASAFRYGGAVAGDAASMGLNGAIRNVKVLGDMSGLQGPDASSVGGLVGRISSNGKIAASFAAISAMPSYAGGLCGGIVAPQIQNSFWDTEVSGISTSCVGTGVGLDTAAMKTANTYALWDPAQWIIADGQYPQPVLSTGILIDESDAVPTGSGTVRVKGFRMDGSPVVETKWASGDKSGSAGISYFHTGGTAFTDSFDVAGPGTYTVYMKNANGGESLRTFVIPSTALNLVRVANKGVSPPVLYELSYDDSIEAFVGYVPNQVSSIVFGLSGADTSATVTMKDEQENDMGIVFSATLGQGGLYSYTITVTNGPAMTTYKVYLYKADPLSVALQPSTTALTGRVIVNVSASGAYNRADKIKWAPGIWTAQDFAAESFGNDLTGRITVTDSVYKAQFEVDENGDYTVYIQDRFSQVAVRTIHVSNIMKEAPSITFEEPAPNGPTDGEVSVPVTLSVYGSDNGNGLTAARWLPGQMTTESFAGANGTDLIPKLTVTDSVYRGQLTIADNGWYTVYARDLAGNESVNSVQVTNIIEPNADLSGLTLSSGTLSPAFSPGVLHYTATVGYHVSSITVTPTAAESHSTLAANGSPAASGVESAPISLSVGDNAITIVVTALNGVATQTYTIDVTRSSRPSDPDSYDPPPKKPTDIQVIVDGKPQEQIASGELAQDRDGRSVFTVTVDAAKLSSQLAREGERPNVLIPVEQGTDKVSAVLTGDAVKAMENKQAVLEVRTPNGNYKLPASEMFIDRLSGQLGNPEDLSKSKCTLKSPRVETPRRLCSRMPRRKASSPSRHLRWNSR